MDEAQIAAALACVDDIEALTDTWASQCDGGRHSLVTTEPYRDGVRVALVWCDGDVDRAFDCQPKDLISADAFRARWEEALEEYEAAKAAKHEAQKARERKELKRRLRCEMAAMSPEDRRAMLAELQGDAEQAQKP